MADGDEQSIRILPSQSSVMNAPLRVDRGVDDGEVEAVPLADLAPVGDGGAAQRVGADAHAGLADAPRGRRRWAGRRRSVPRKSYEPASAERLVERRRAGRPSRPSRISSLARAAMTDVASVSAGPPWGGLYLNPPSAGGLCDGVTTMPSASPAPAGAALPRLSAEDRVRHGRASACSRRGRRRAPDPVGDEHLEGRAPGRLGQAVRVAADEERAVEALRDAVVDDRLRRREDVVLVERRVQAGPAVPRRAEGDLLVGVVDVRAAGRSRRRRGRRRRRGPRPGPADRRAGGS